MEINAKTFNRIMSKNFGCKIVHTELGDGIRTDPFSAFIFSSVTGAGYLDNPIYPFTPKGLMKVFYNALDYKFVTGLFDNTNLKNTPYSFSLAKKFLFDSDKTIIPVEFDSERELQKKLELFIEELAEPSTNFIIQRIETSKKGNGMEPFMEYLTCEIMRKEDFIVENQVPLSYSKGSPDFAGYILEIPPNLRTTFGGLHLIELALLRLGWKREKQGKSHPSKLIVGEAKTSTAEMAKQLQKYISTGFFNEAFEIQPTKTQSSDERYSLITIDKDCTIRVVRRKNGANLSDPIKQKVYAKWLENYIKYYLIANLTNDEFLSFYHQKTGERLSSLDDVTRFVNSLTYVEILNKIAEVCNNGAIQ